jgi:serine/threonine-protein kinase PknG
MTSTVIKCTGPGCGGTIDGGYCHNCGPAPDLAQPTASAAPAPSSGPGSTGTTGAGSGHAGSGSGSRRTRAGSTRSSRDHLGAGLVDIPPVPAHAYHAQARLAPDRRRRIELAGEANSVRPRTWV